MSTCCGPGVLKTSCVLFLQTLSVELLCAVIGAARASPAGQILTLADRTGSLKFFSKLQVVGDNKSFSGGLVVAL
jgi:hypothetical protein